MSRRSRIHEGQARRAPAPRMNGDRPERLGAVEEAAQDAGIRDGRLHDARHTAATVLPLLGVSERTMMGLMGWSNRVKESPRCGTT